MKDYSVVRRVFTGDGRCLCSTCTRADLSLRGLRTLKNKNREGGSERASRHDTHRQENTFRYGTGVETQLIVMRLVLRGGGGCPRTRAGISKKEHRYDVGAETLCGTQRGLLLQGLVGETLAARLVCAGDDG